MSGSIGDSFKALAGPQVLALAIGVVVTGVVGRIIALKLALRVAYKGNKTALMVLKLLSGKSPRLYAFQDYLPNLPLPRLKDSLRKWLESVQPLVSDEDFKKAQEAARKLETSPEGKSLQKVLEKRAATLDNWLSDWWVEFAYLRGRVPLPTNVSFFCTDSYRNLLGNLEPVEKDPIKRAVGMVQACLDFKHNVDTEKLKPLRIGGVLPICMDSFKQCFGTNRVPGEIIDTLVTHQVPKGGSAHVLLIVGACLFKLPVIVRGKRVPNDTMESAIRAAQNHADALPATAFGKGRNAELPVALLTSRDRTKWAQARTALLASGGANADSIREAEEALFCVSLLDGPSGLAEAYKKSDGVDCMEDAIQPYIRDGLVGVDGSKVWFDKCFSLMVYTDARVAWHFEHTYADAHINGLMSEHALVYSNEISRKWRLYKAPVLPQWDRQAPATLLRWDGNTAPALPMWVADARKEFDQLLKGFAFKPIYWVKFGATRIKKAKMSPDAFCQAVLQVAGIGYFGKPILTYEAAALRVFKGGRTETIRSATKDMVGFAKDFLALSKGGKKVAGEDKTRLAAMLRAAGDRHSKLAKAAGKFEGCDRHLLGLKLAALTTGEKVPELFSTAAWQLEFQLSTSQSPILQEHTKVPQELELYTLGGGFGPVADPGIGCSYHILPNRIYFYVSCRAPDASKGCDDFRARVRAALDSIVELLE